MRTRQPNKVLSRLSLMDWFAQIMSHDIIFKQSDTILRGNLNAVRYINRIASQRDSVKLR